MTKPGKIGVLLVDDSPIALATMRRALAQAPDIEVVGTAANGLEALRLVPLLDPAVICTDIHMPVMDGIAFVGEVMALYPRPMLVVSVSAREGSPQVFRALDAGALDVMLKPRGEFALELRRFSAELIAKVRILSGVHVFRKPERRPIVPGGEAAGLCHRGPRPQIVIIGASTGGPQTLHLILSQLPADFRLPIVCVQHISEGFLGGFVEWLGSLCRVRIELARPGGAPLAGVVYFPPERTHLKIDDRGRFVSSAEPSFNGHRPSITVTMRSAVQYFGGGTVGVILTGMGNDGVEGMQAVERAGGITIAQNEESSVVFGMPRQAIGVGAARHVLPPDGIARMLLQLQGENASAKG